MIISLLLLSISAHAATGAAKIKGTADGSKLSGTVTVEDTDKGLRVRAALTGVPAGEHGFHIHEFGSCEDAAKAAGSHYNPHGAPHGLATKVGVKKAHAGDLGNITADKSGAAAIEALLPKLAVASGKHPVAGRAVVIHEKADDFGQPVGNAGGRIGCGVIGVTGN
jgi:superoxide dismutase, Cu-Zn family